MNSGPEVIRQCGKLFSGEANAPAIVIIGAHEKEVAPYDALGKENNIRVHAIDIEKHFGLSLYDDRAKQFYKEEFGQALSVDIASPPPGFEERFRKSKGTGLPDFN